MKHPPSPKWKSLDGYGEGDSRRFTARLPAELAARYRASGVWRLRRDRKTGTVVSLAIPSMTVTDNRTGSAVRFTGTRATITTGDDASLSYVRGLWQAAKDIRGLATEQLGGRPSSKSDRLVGYRRAIRELMPSDGPYPTIGAVLEYLLMHATDEKQVRRDIEPYTWREWIDTLDG